MSRKTRGHGSEESKREMRTTGGNGVSEVKRGCNEGIQEGNGDIRRK